MISKCCFLFFFVAAIAHSAYGYANGAPEDACNDMIPQHHIDPQSSRAPYSLTVSRKTIRSGDEVTLTVSGKTAKDTIKGFLIQARQGNQPVGSFKVQPNDKFFQVINCGGGVGNAVTHRQHDPNEDRPSITVTWVAPKNLKNEIKFRATVVLNGGVFWVGVESNSVKIY